MEKERTSKKQQALLGFIDGFIRQHGYGPSYREIMTGLEYKSVSTVAVHIDNLIAKGYLSRKDKSARSLEVVSLNGVHSAVTESSPQLEHQLQSRIDTLDIGPEDQKTLLYALRLMGFDTVTVKGVSDEASS